MTRQCLSTTVSVPSSELGPQHPLPPASVSLLSEWGEGHALACGWGGGRVPIRTNEEKNLPLCLLCGAAYVLYCNLEASFFSESSVALSENAYLILESCLRGEKSPIGFSKAHSSQRIHYTCAVQCSTLRCKRHRIKKTGYISGAATQRWILQRLHHRMNFPSKEYQYYSENDKNIRLLSMLIFHANNLLWCSRWKIHRYVAGLFFYFRKVAADYSKPLLFSKNEWVECWIGSREYWLIYRGPGFLAVVCFGSSPPPLSCQQLVSLSQSICVFRSRLLPGGGQGVGEEPNHTMGWKPDPL